MYCLHRFLMLATMTLAGFAPAGEPKKDGPKSKNDPSVVPSGLRKISEKVENGSVYDKATLGLEGFDKLIVPENAKVVEDTGVKEAKVFQCKTLSFAGHPPRPISLQHVRKYMGCATKAEGKTLLLATFGEWDTRREGTATMRLSIVVPKRFVVEKQKALSGTDSKANQRSIQGGPPKELKDGYWYGPITPGEGWTAVASVPDPDRKASR